MDIKSDQIFDPIHGFVVYNNLEKLLIQSEPFYRLRFIRQTGCVFLLYPGATHTRFDHSIGVMHLATKIYEALIRKLEEENETLPAISNKKQYNYWKQIVRLAALCHDLGHLPLSHTFEKEVFGKMGHELMTYRIIHSFFLKEIWKPIAISLKVSIKKLVDDITAVALGRHFFQICTQEKKDPPIFSSWTKVLSEIITSDFFGADRIDYLLRDGHFTGLVYGMFDYPQIIDTLRFFKRGKDLEIGVTHSGIQAVEGLILTRYFMFIRVFYHPQVKSYSILFQTFFKEAFKNKKKGFQDPQKFIYFTDNEFFAELTLAGCDINHPAHKIAEKITHFNYYKPVRISYENSISQKSQLTRHLNILKSKHGDLINLHFCEEFLKQRDHKKILPSWMQKGFLVGSHFRGQVKSSHQYSEMIQKIPSTITPWIFIDPSIYSKVTSYLKKYKLFEC